MPIKSNIGDFNARIDGVMGQIPELLDRTVEAVNREAINHAKSYTNQVVPGVRVNDGPRFTHPGGWSDRSSNLMNAYDHEVVRLGDYKRLGVLLNTMEYAAYLERIGYWVLSGLFEGVIQAIARRRVADLIRYISRRMR